MRALFVSWWLLADSAVSWLLFSLRVVWVGGVWVGGVGACVAGLLLAGGGVVRCLVGLVGLVFFFVSVFLADFGVRLVAVFFGAGFRLAVAVLFLVDRVGVLVLARTLGVAFGAVRPLVVRCLATDVTRPQRRRYFR